MMCIIYNICVIWFDAPIKWNKFKTENEKCETLFIYYSINIILYLILYNILFSKKEPNLLMQQNIN